MIWLLLACTSTDPALDDTAGGGTAATVDDYTARGPHAVGVRSLQTTDAQRPLDVLLFYPADTDTSDTTLTELIREGADQDSYRDLLAVAPAGCASDSVAATPNAPASPGARPVIISSHCHSCTNFSKASVASHLASHGFVVLAPEHSGNALWDHLAGTGAAVDSDTLALRVTDLQQVLDLVEEGIDGAELDTDRIGLLGHSFGSVTAGATLLAEPGRVTSGMFVGAPIDSPLLPGVDAAEVVAPSLFMLLEEDGSITELGNNLIISNSEEVVGPTRLIELAEAGHWSVSDLCGAHEIFMDGCGDFIAPDRGRLLTGAVAAAFFAETLLGNESGTAWLAATGQSELTVSVP